MDVSIQIRNQAHEQKHVTFPHVHGRNAQYLDYWVWARVSGILNTQKGVWIHQALILFFILF